MFFPTTSCNSRSYPFQQHHPTSFKRGGVGGFPPQVSKERKEQCIQRHYHRTFEPSNFGTIQLQYHSTSLPTEDVLQQHHVTNEAILSTNKLQKHHVTNEAILSTNKLQKGVWDEQCIQRQYHRTSVPSNFSTILRQYHRASVPSYSSTIPCQHHPTPVPVAQKMFLLHVKFSCELLHKVFKYTTKQRMVRSPWQQTSYRLHCSFTLNIKRNSNFQIQPNSVQQHKYTGIYRHYHSTSEQNSAPKDQTPPKSAGG